MDALTCYRADFWSPPDCRQCVARRCLLLRSILYYRYLNSVVILGVVVAGAALTGALMVGDSVKESLRRLSSDRLGSIQYALTPQHMLSSQLAEKLRTSPNLQQKKAIISQVIRFNGSVSTRHSRASRVSITGIDAHFTSLYPDTADGEVHKALLKRDGQIFPSAVINRQLASEMQLSVGDDMLLSFAKDSAIHRESLYGKKNTADVVQQIRVTVRLVLENEGIGCFSLNSHQAIPFNLFLDLDQMRRALGREQGANTLLFGAPAGEFLEEPQLEQALRANLELEDLNLILTQHSGYLSLETPGFFFSPQMAATAKEIAANLDQPLMSISTYLANRMEAGQKSIPYSLISALDLTQTATLQGRAPAEADEVVLNRWSADDLGVEIGDEVDLFYYTPDQEPLQEQKVRLRIVGILPMAGLGADKTLTPNLPGADGAQDMGEWEPTFPMDMSLIRPQDENYWDVWHTAPKYFISEKLARQLWASRFGYYTGFRFTPHQAEPNGAETLKQALLTTVEPASVGLSLQPVKARGQQASQGATDFTGLFIGLSFFIIVSACMLISLFFRLSVASRRSQAGLLLAMGYTRAKVRRRFLAEGLLISIVGSLLGALAGMGYAQGVMAGLRHFWDLGTKHLYFHYQPDTLVLGILLAVSAAVASILISLRMLKGETLLSLIRQAEPATEAGATGRARKLLAISLWLTLITAIAMLISPTKIGIGFSLGVSFFVAGLAAFAYLIRRTTTTESGGIWSMANRNNGRRPGRSLVSVTLVAMAVYTLVAVGLYRHTGEVDSDELRSGSGGYFLAAEAEVPLHFPLEEEQKRAEYTMSEALTNTVANSQIVSLRLQAGDDASCLNLFAPRQPRILGLDDAARFKDRFTFQAHQGSDGVDPWRLLEQPLSDGAIPVIGDLNSVMWILKSGLGKHYSIEDEFGQQATLRFVGLLKGSIFQSELIMSEANYQKLYPQSGGYGYFLFASQAPKREELMELEEALSDYGFDITSTAATLRRYHAIENTYITIFQMLGGLGLLLGTLGLGAIIYRNALERKGELAAMRAFGYRRMKIAQIQMAENALLVIWGIVVGTLSAVFSMIPHLLTTHTAASAPLILGTLLAIFITSMLSTLWAVNKASRLPLLASLRWE